MVEIVTQLRSYQHASNVRGETRQMAQRAADEIDRLRAALHWALGDGPDADGKWFGEVDIPMFRGKPAPFGWRRHLRKIAGMGDLVYDKEKRTIVDRADEQSGEK
jgi:hypothetical protein